MDFFYSTKSEADHKLRIVKRREFFKRIIQKMLKWLNIIIAISAFSLIGYFYEQETVNLLYPITLAIFSHLCYVMFHGAFHFILILTILLCSYLFLKVEKRFRGWFELSADFFLRDDLKK
ncbi:MAG: hypothetical protein WC471_03095 [Candidatus Woesearchaeota archaeon]